jgi:hypothetical protein
MEFLENIKEKVGSYILTNKIKSVKRTKSLYSLDTAKEIGIIIHATDSKVYEAVCNFIKYLTERKIKVASLSYIEKKEVLDLYSLQLGMLYFTNSDLNWYYKPKNHNTDDFINARFDILIDLSLEEVFPLQYIVNLSRAKYKVGRFTSEESVYDLMINLKKENNVEFLIEQITHYLKIIKSR